MLRARLIDSLAAETSMGTRIRVPSTPSLGLRSLRPHEHVLYGNTLRCGHHIILSLMNYIDILAIGTQRHTNVLHILVSRGKCLPIPRSYTLRILPRTRTHPSVRERRDQILG